MADLILSGSTSGTVTVSSPAISGSSVLTLPVATDTLVGKATTDTLTNKTLTSPTISGTPVMGASVLTSATAQNSTSGTSIDFTGIPSWVKRITVMFNGVSTNGTSIKLIQIGSGSITVTGYSSAGSTVYNNPTTTITTSTAGMCVYSTAATDTMYGHLILTNVSGNIWCAIHTLTNTTANVFNGGGGITLAGVLDRVRITTVNGTDTFDAGSINIIYE